MFVRIFKSNQPILLIAMPLIAISIWMRGFIYPAELTISDPMPLYRIVAGAVSGHFLSRLTGIIFLLSGAFMISYIADKHEISKRSFLPGLIYILMCSTSVQSTQLHPVLISNLFLLFAAHKLLEIYRREDTFSEIFDAGFLISMASLFYFPTILFFLMVLIGLLLFHPFIWREWAIAIIGFVLPFLFSFVVYYLADLPFEDFLRNTAGFGIEQNYLMHFTTAMKIYMGVCGLILALALLSTIADVKGIKLKTKKATSFNYWYLAVGIFVILITPFEITESALVAVPVSIIFANYFIGIKRWWLAELLFAVFAVSSLITLYNSY